MTCLEGAPRCRPHHVQDAAADVGGVRMCVFLAQWGGGGRGVSSRGGGGGGVRCYMLLNIYFVIFHEVEEHL